VKTFYLAKYSLHKTDQITKVNDLLRTIHIQTSFINKQLV